MGLASSAAARLKRWWDVVSDEEFLSSRLSRRTSWGWLFPLVFMLLSVLPDLLLILDGAVSFSQLLVDSFVVISSFGLRHIPVESLKRDALLTTMIVTAGISYFGQLRPDLRMAVNGYPEVPLVLVLMGGLGIRSIMIGVFLFATMSFAYLQDSFDHGVNHDGIIQTGMIGVATLVSILALESIIADFYRELQEERRANSSLLKQCDCSFTVRSLTGVWETTDASVTEMFGGTLGDDLLSHVHPRDAAVVADMIRHADRNIGRPLVATFTMPRGEFDAKVLIHRVFGGNAHMALTLVGEVRSLLVTGSAAANSDSDFVAPRATLAPMGNSDCDGEEREDENEAVAELHDDQREPEKQRIEELWVRFDAGMPNFAIGEGSGEMCPGWLDWVPLVLRRSVESWVMEELRASDPDEASANARQLGRDADEEMAMIAAAEAREPRVLCNFELRVPTGTVVARRAWVEREEPYSIEDGREVLSAVLRLQGSTVSEPHRRRQTAACWAASGLPDGAARAEAASSAGDSEILDDSISIVNRRFLVEQP